MSHVKFGETGALCHIVVVRVRTVVAAGGQSSSFRSRASTSRGFTMGIRLEWSSPCGGCQKTLTKASNPKKCGKCNSVWYCSKECQTLDWKRPNKQGHKHRCAALAEADKLRGAGNPRSQKAFEAHDSKPMMDRFHEILQRKIQPGERPYEVMSKMLEDGVAKGARAIMMIHEEVLGNGTIEFTVVPEAQVEVMLEDDAAFSRHALMVRTYDPEKQFVICYETSQPERHIVFRVMAEDILNRRS